MTFFARARAAPINFCVAANDKLVYPPGAIFFSGLGKEYGKKSKPKGGQNDLSSLWKPSRAEVTISALCHGGRFYCGNWVHVLTLVRETYRLPVTVVGRSITGLMPVKIRWRVGDSKGGKIRVFPLWRVFLLPLLFARAKRSGAFSLANYFAWLQITGQPTGGRAVYHFEAMKKYFERECASQKPSQKAGRKNYKY